MQISVSCSNCEHCKLICLIDMNMAIHIGFAAMHNAFSTDCSCRCCIEVCQLLDTIITQSCICCVQLHDIGFASKLVCARNVSTVSSRCEVRTDIGSGGQQSFIPHNLTFISILILHSANTVLHI